MRLLLAFIAIVAVSNSRLSTSDASVINYGNLIGSNVFFNGISENPSFNPTPTTGLYGTPTVSGDMLVFAPLSFEANTTGQPSVNSILSASLVAKPGFFITGVRFEEFGDYAIALPFGGSGSVSASLNATVGIANNSDIFVASSNTIPGIVNGTFNNPSFPINFAPTHSVSLSATNTLTAQTQGLITDAFIKKKGFKLTVSTVIPEPTSALIFLGLGLAGLSSRRRR